MKRKTNLFYTTGYDSKFITFSNYTESMTGNFLSTNTKLFPSRFIALTIKNLNEISKRHIIKYLALYYESKLAACRDELEKNNTLAEDEMLPLNYLLEALYSISDINNQYVELVDGTKISDFKTEDETDDELEYSSDIEADEEAQESQETPVDNNLNIYGSDTPNINDSIAGTDNDIVVIGGDSNTYESSDDDNEDITENSSADEEYAEEDEDSSDELEETILIPNFSSELISLNYIGEITEQNYNGTFTDTICIIDLNEYKRPIIQTVSTETYDDKNVQIEIPKSNKDNKECIYGWENEVLEEYKNCKSLFDIYNSEIGQYRLNSYIEKLLIEGNGADINELEFNCIIPLYDLVNTDYNSNFSNIKELTEINLLSNTERDDNSIYKLYNLNVPLGMWFYTNGEEIDENSEPSTTLIKLYRDSETGFSQSWSLTISSQFKPFPYSKSMPNEICTNEDSSAFMTFAQVLANQNRLIDKINEYTYQFRYMDERLANIQNQLNNIGTLYNIDNVHKEMANFENYMNDNYSEFKEQIYSYINNLRWKVTE